MPGGPWFNQQVLVSHGGAGGQQGMGRSTPAAGGKCLGGGWAGGIQTRAAALVQAMDDLPLEDSGMLYHWVTSQYKATIPTDGPEPARQG